MSDVPLTWDRLNEAIDYNPETGVFVWKVPTARSRIGDKAGHRGPGGRQVITLDGVNYYGARLAWFYVHREWPKGKIIQKSGDKSDCRIAFLEDVSQSDIIANAKTNALNTSGIKGVSWSKAKSKWVAMITRDGVQYYLGRFDTKEEAALAYRRAAEEGVLPEKGSVKDPGWKESRRQRSAKWSDIQANPRIVGWDTLEAFLAEVGAPPTADHVLMRHRYDAPLGPGNVMWRLPWAKRDGHNDDPQRSYNLGMRNPNALPGDYDRFFARQDGRCAICGEPETAPYLGKPRRLSIDHDHETDKNRGLLCGRCNRALGYFDDDPERLLAAADYIRHGGVTFDPDEGVCGVCHRPTDNEDLALDYMGETLGRYCDQCQSEGVHEERQAEMEYRYRKRLGHVEPDGTVRLSGGDSMFNVVPIKKDTA